MGRRRRESVVLARSCGQSFRPRDAPARLHVTNGIAFIDVTVSPT